MTRGRLGSAATAAWFVGVAVAAEPILWREGEQAERRLLVANAGLDAVDPEELSGGAWASSFANGEQSTGMLEHDLVLPAAGSHRLWVRGTGALACRIDGGAWRVADAKHYSDHTSIAADGNFGYPTIGWFDLGEVPLAAGNHTVVWRLGGEGVGPGRFGAVDCFVLASGAFAPNGKCKPGEALPVTRAFAPGETWDFTPAADAFDPAALLDLRALNEPVAGEKGFVKLAGDGESFLRGDGQPLRFWAAGLRTSYVDLPLDAMRHRMRFLAKRGVNLVRIFAMLPPDKPGPLADVNERELDSVFRLVAACKESGIYVVVCGYWGTHTQRQPGWDLADSGKHDMGSLVFYDPKAQAAYRHWMRALLDRPNPHAGGTRLADEPAVAVVQLQNEDNLLWWDFANIQGEARRLLRLRYAEFLVGKHGSLEKALAAWQGYKAEFPADDLAAGLPGFLHIWDLTRDGTSQKHALPGFMARSSDQLEFVGRLTRRFNEETIGWLRKEVGCKSLINAGNWQTVDMTATMDTQYWGDAAAEVMARNAYTGGFHFGVNNGWQILAGHIYQDKSMLLHPRAWPLNVRQTAGHPFFFPELLWTLPGGYQAESALLTAGQMSLTGLDGACWFSNFPDEWTPEGNVKWTFSTPMQIGQFPAAALIYRQGLLRQGAPAVVEHRALSNLWARDTPMTSEDPGFDPNRHTGIPRIGPSAAAGVDALAPLVGAVAVVHDSDPAKSTVVDLAKYIDSKAKVVRAITGEIETDYGVGVYRINAPKAQGAVGFLGAAGPQTLSDVVIDCRTPYAAVMAVSLDDRPLTTSGRVLVQLGTVARPTGWATRPARIRQGEDWVACQRIVSLGTPPWQIQRIDGTLTIANARLDQARVLDPNGMPIDAQVELRRSEGKVALALPPGTLYVLLQAAGEPAHP